MKFLHVLFCLFIILAWGCSSDSDPQADTGPGDALSLSEAAPDALEEVPDAMTVPEDSEPSEGDTGAPDAE